jgi:predicted amidohydrolase YtcJ
MATADLVLFGTVLTVDERQPTAEGIAVSDGRIVAVGDRAKVETFVGPKTRRLDVDGCVLPGLVEAHGHPVMEAMVLSDRMADIRPVTLPTADAVVDAIKGEVAKRGTEGAFLNGWDPLLQTGLPQPTLAWLDGVAPDTPLVIIHNSGHKAYFNSAAARRAGLTRDTPDPKGAKYGRDANGDLDGTAEETAAVFSLLGGAIQPADYPSMLHAELARLNRAGLTTCSEMAFDPLFRPLIEQMRDQLSVRLRVYEMSTAQMVRDVSPVITGCGSNTSAPSRPRSCSAHTTSASRAACSSTRFTIGATSSSTVCSDPSTGSAGCHAARPSRPACGSPCTTILPSHRRNRCATSASPPRAQHRRAACWHRKSG